MSLRFRRCRKDDQRLDWTGVGAMLTFAVVAEGHLGLAETNGVFASADAIELFELGLLNVL